MTQLEDTAGTSTPLGDTPVPASPNEQLDLFDPEQETQ
jgi:hypothetical protein